VPRNRYRACLQDGLKLDLNRLARKGFVKLGAATGPVGIGWRHSYWDELIQGTISADMTGQSEGWLHVRAGNFSQCIALISQKRHFGGRQWYFLCPRLDRTASVLWKPPGAKRFLSRRAWGQQVAYASQFLDRDNRAHYGQSKLKSRLCSIGQFDPDEWDFPPKPKWMRWKTYNRYEERFDRHEAQLNAGLEELVAKLKLLESK
jgi:hypothetical protein